MSDTNNSVDVSASADVVLAEVVAQITDRLHAGEAVDVEEYITVDPTDWQTAYVVDGNSNVWMTTDAAASWTNIAGNLGKQVSKLRTVEVVRPQGAAGPVYVLVGGLGGPLHDGGVFLTVNPSTARGMKTKWMPYGKGLPNAQVFDLHVRQHRQRPGGRHVRPGRLDRLRLHQHLAACAPPLRRPREDSRRPRRPLPRGPTAYQQTRPVRGARPPTRLPLLGVSAASGELGQPRGAASVVATAGGHDIVRRKVLAG
jgi:hypothetical protein